nr:hypothetical protein [Tanacetum cinerariifolium]
MIPPSTHVDSTPIPIVSPTIPPSLDYTPAPPDYTPASLDFSPASDMKFDQSEDPSSDHIPPLPATSPFLSLIDDSLDSDILDSPPSPTYGTPLTENTLSTQRSPATSSALQRRVMVLAPGRSSSDHSLPAPSSGMRPSHHLCSLVLSIHRSSAAISARPSHDSSSLSPYHKRSRSQAVSVSLSLHIPGALSYTRADHLPSPKRIRSSEIATSDGIDIDPEIHVEIDECITNADALRDRGIDVRVLVEAVDRDEEEGDVEVTYETLGDLVKTFHDHTIKILVHCVQAIEGALGARDVARNPEPLMGNEENGNGGNGNGNGNGGGNGYNFGGFMHVKECTYQDFLKCQSLSFNRTEEVVGLTRWFEKMEMMFHIRNCPKKYQVKCTKCTLLNSALTWWNSHKRTIRIKAVYSMSWVELMKLMTEVGRFQELVLLCTRMVPNEEDKVERFIGVDQKLKGYARSAKNKRRLENNPRDNRGQQPVFKRQNVRGQNVARAYTAGSNEKKSHMTRDCKVTITQNTQRAPARNQPGIVCYECERPS